MKADPPCMLPSITLLLDPYKMYQEGLIFSDFSTMYSEYPPIVAYITVRMEGMNARRHVCSGYLFYPCSPKYGLHQKNGQRCPDAWDTMRAALFSVPVPHFLAT